MPYNIDPNQMRDQINSMFGPNAYENRVNMISNVAKLKVQLDQAQKSYNTRLKAHNELIRKQQAAAQKAATHPKKKSYIDAVNELAIHGNIPDPAKLANEIKNDPTKQQAIKDQGYTVTDYINALYNASSNGKYRSEREYKQAQAAKKKQASDPLANLPKTPTKQPSNHSHPGILGMIGNEFNTLKNDAGQVISALLHPTSAQANNKALSNIKKNGDVASPEVKRFANRAVDSASFGLYGNLDNKANGGQKQDYQSMDGRSGAGKAADIAASLLGGATTGGVLLDALKLGRLGNLTEQGIKSLGAGEKLAKLGGIASRGAIGGGAYGLVQQSIDAGFNPNSQTNGQRLGNIGIDAALGAGADLGLSGLQKAFSPLLQKLARGEKLTPHETQQVQQVLALPAPQKALPEPKLGLPEPKMVTKITKTTVPIQDSAIPGAKLTKIAKTSYTSKYESLVNDFNKLQSEGKITPGREYEVAKEMWSHIAGPKDPSFDNMLVLANDNPKIKSFSPQEKLKMIKQARSNATYGRLNVARANPGTMTDVNVQTNPLNYVGNLKNPIATRIQSVDPNAKPIEPLAQLKQTLKQVAPTAEPKAMNISSAEPSLKKLTKSELIQEQNMAQFAKNNTDQTIPDTSGHIVSKKDLKPSVKGLLDLAYTKGVDNLHPLNKFDKAVEKVTGIPLKPSENTHMLALNSRGSDQISKQILTQNLVNSKNEVIGQSLKDITKNLDSNQLKLFEDYLVNKHAITRMQRGEKVFSNDMKMSPEKSAQIVKSYEKQYPEFKQLAKQYYDYNKKLGKAWLVDTGIITKDEWNAYLEKNPYYVPNHRAFNPLEKSMNFNAKRGYAGQSNPVKKATGSQRKIISPIESTIEHTARYVKTAKRNEVMQALIKNITKNPEDFKGFAEIVKTEKTPHSVLDTLNKEGIDGLLSEFNKGFDQKPDLTHGNIVTGIIDGQKVHVRVHDPQLLDALTNLAPPEQHLVFKFFGKVTRVMKNLTTGINPVFSLTRNVFRDIPTSYTNSKTVNNPVKFSKDLISAFIDVVGNREAYQSFKNFGGGHSSPISSDVNLLAQSKRSILKQKGIKPLLGKGLGALENLNNAIESAPRLAEYKRTAVPGNYDSHIQALYNANDITTNFNKFGNFTKGLDSLVPYLNAAVQGLDKMARQFKENPVQTAIKAAGSITLPTIILYAVNHNNPNYQQLSNYVKDNNFLIPLPNGTFYKIPKPRELGMVFSTDIERTLRAWADSDPHAFQGFVQDVIGNFAPPVRTIVSPFNDLRANKNFMGAPIVPGDLQNLSPKYQYDSQTSSLARGLGNLTNKSPKQIDYLIKSYGGVLGQLGIPAMSPGATVGSTLKNQVIADPVFSNDIMSNFYNTKNKLDMARNDYTKQGAVSPDLNEKLRKAFDSQGRKISKVRKEIKAVQNSSVLSNKDKQDKIRQLQQIMNQIAQQTNQLAR